MRQRPKCFVFWSGRWESNPRPKLGKLLYCHCTTPARFSGASIIINKRSAGIDGISRTFLKTIPFRFGLRLRTTGFYLLRYNSPMGILRRLSRWMESQDQMTHIVAGNIAPGFALKSLDHQQYSLHNLMESGPVVAAFFKISCPVCQFTFPFLERLHQRYGSSGVTVLGVSQDDARATKGFASEYGVTF